MVILKLTTHPKNSSKYDDAELVLCQKDLPELERGDVVEIYREDETSQPRLVLQYSKVFPEGVIKEKTISIEKTLANEFKLTNYCNVVVRKIDLETVMR